MILSHEPPPNYEEIKKVMGAIWDEGVVFAYGDTIHTKRDDLLPDILIHEAVHQRQQGNSPSVWWNMYLKDWTFRYNQEKAAYAEQILFLKRVIKDRNVLYRCMVEVAKDFSSRLYGPIISYEEAIKMFTKL